MKLLGAVAVQLAVMLLAAVTAHAHAVLLESSPADNAFLKAPPREVVLRFNARIEKGVSRFTLLDYKGRKLALTPQPEGGADAPGRIIIPLPVIGPGAYRLEYFVLASDGHSTPGVIRFTVKGGAPR